MRIKKRDWTDLAVQLLYAALGIWFIVNRARVFAQLTGVMALVLLLCGAWGILLYFINKRGGLDFGPPVPALMLLLFGVLLFLLRKPASAFVPLLMGIWMLVMAVAKLADAFWRHTAGQPRWWAPLLSTALYLFGGVIVLCDLDAVNAVFALLLGLWMLFTALFNIAERLIPLLHGKK